MTKKLKIEEIKQKLQDITNWNISEDNLFLICEYKFKNWLEVMDFIKKISKIAENLNHHPNINFTYGFCKIKTQTHDVGGITQLDFELATKINGICNT